MQTTETAMVSIDRGPVEMVGIPGRLTATGLVLPEHLAFDEWNSIGLTLCALDAGIQWWLGDWLNYGERKYGETYTQAQAITGRKYSSLTQYAWVANRIELCTRVQSLSWTHHREVAALEPDDQSAWLRLADENDWSANDLRNAIRDSGSEQQQPSPNGMAVHYSSDSPEWYTPRHVVERVGRAMGGIDLDPCSNSHDDPAVPATHLFTSADDGLAQRWSGRVYMNPPYGDAIGKWADKLSSEFERGHIDEAVALVPARTDTTWFRRFPAEYVCFINGRLTFSDADAPAPFPSALIYLGDRPERFIAAMNEIGVVYRRAVVDA